jgi:hypothetical protein
MRPHPSEAISKNDVELLGEREPRPRIVGRVTTAVKAGDVLELDGNGYINKATPPLVTGRVVPAGPQADPKAYAPIPAEAKLALRYDAGKPRLDMIPVLPLFYVGQVFAFGASKYSSRNWVHGNSFTRCLGALLRHVFRCLAGEWLDPESGLPHLAHAAFWTLVIMEWKQTHPEMDDRPTDAADPTLSYGEAS